MKTVQQLTEDLSAARVGLEKMAKLKALETIRGGGPRDRARGGRRFLLSAFRGPGRASIAPGSRGGAQHREGECEALRMGLR